MEWLTDPNAWVGLLTLTILELVLGMLALSFLLLIGVNLIAEGLGFHIPRGYTYFAMAFSLFVEMLNLKMRSRRPVQRLIQSRRLQRAIDRIKAP